MDCTVDGLDGHREMRGVPGLHGRWADHRVPERHPCIGPRDSFHEPRLHSSLGRARGHWGGGSGRALPLGSKFGRGHWSTRAHRATCLDCRNNIPIGYQVLAGPTKSFLFAKFEIEGPIFVPHLGLRGPRTSSALLCAGARYYCLSCWESSWHLGLFVRASREGCITTVPHSRR